MVKKRQKLPVVNDLVICTVTDISSHGAFVALDEYQGNEGFIHISEVASTWIKNIRDFVKKGQKTVAKVLSVDPKKGHVDLSLRRVGEAQKKNKRQEWKRAQKADKLLELAAGAINKTLDEAYEKVGFKLEDEFGEIYAGFEEIALSGAEAAKSIGLPQEWIEPLTKVATENVVPSKVKITGYLDLRCTLPNGIEVIKEALINAREDKADVKMDVRYTKSPRFSVALVAPDYKVAEESLKRYADKVLEIIKSKGGVGEFVREKAG